MIPTLALLSIPTWLIVSALLIDEEDGTMTPLDFILIQADVYAECLVLEGWLA